MGVNGIHPHFGFTTPDREEATIKELAMSLSREAFILADDSKFTEVAFAKIADIEAATIITNELERDIEKQYEEKTVIKVVTS